MRLDFDCFVINSVGLRVYSLFLFNLFVCLTCVYSLMFPFLVFLVSFILVGFVGDLFC